MGRKRKENIKQHYVPQYYLRNFANNNHLFVYDFINDKVFNSNILNIGSEKYFYDTDADLLPILIDITSNEQKETFFDDQIRLQNEELCSPIIKGFKELSNQIKEYDDGKSVLLPDKQVLIDFILIQYVRTKKFRKQFDYVADVFLEEISKYDLPKEIKSKERDLWVSYFHNTFLYSVLSICNLTEGIQLSDRQHKANRSLIKRISDFKLELEKATVFYIHNRTNINFITSDNPVCIYSETNELTNFQALYLPLALNFSVVFLNQKLREYSGLDKNIQLIEKKNVSLIENYNLFLTYFAEQRVFSYSNDFKQIEEFVKGNTKFKFMIPLPNDFY